MEEHIRRLRAISAELGTIAGELDKLDQVTVDPVLMAPPWPAGTLDRSDARSAGPGNELEVVLSPDTGAGRASSTLHEKHWPLPRPLRRLAWQVDIELDEAMLDARTWKFGGVTAFNGDWAQWPGGGSWGPTNAMARLTGWHFDRAPGSERLATYITFPTIVGPPNRTVKVGGADCWVSANQRTCEWLLPIRPKPHRWYRVRHEIDVDQGTHRTLVDGDVVLELSGLPWPDAGFNRAYVSCMIGGSGPDFLPRTPDRTGRLTYRRYLIAPLPGG